MLFTILDPADFFDTKLTCPTPPDAPSTSSMILSLLDQPMCKGKTATYSCDAGGINAFEVSLRYLAVFDVIWPLLMLFGSWHYLMLFDVILSQLALFDVLIS